MEIERSFFTADHHFGHAKILEHANRPFSTVEEMDRELIARWNAKVPLGSIVYHLGDFAWCRAAQIEEILWQLNGTIRLIMGNHDEKRIKGRIKAQFDWVKDVHQARTRDGDLIVMCHYPFLSWKNKHHGSWNLHGHSHGRVKDDGSKRMDVGVDCHPNYEPFSYDEVLVRMYGRQPDYFHPSADVAD